MLKIGQFCDHLNFAKYEPGHQYVGPTFAKKISVKFTLYPPLHRFQYFSSPCVTLQGVKEGCGKTKKNHKANVVRGGNEG